MSLVAHHASHLVNLGDHSVHHFPLKWAENNGLVLDWIENKPSAWLDHTCPDVVNGGDSNHKAIPGSGNRRLVWPSSLCQWRESLGLCPSKWELLLFNCGLGMRRASLVYYTIIRFVQKWSGPPIAQRRKNAAVSCWYISHKPHLAHVQLSHMHSF